MNILLVLVLIFLLLWAVGLATSFARGGRIHVMLAIAVVLFISWVVATIV